MRTQNHKFYHMSASYYLHDGTVGLGPLNPQYWPLPCDLFQKERQQQQQHVFILERTILCYVRHGLSQRLTGSRIVIHLHPKASVERQDLLVNRIFFLLISSLFHPTCLISSIMFFYFLSLAPGTNSLLFACTSSHFILCSVSSMSSFISNVLPFHQATSQLSNFLADPPLLPMCLTWIFLAPTSHSSRRFFILLSIPNTFIVHSRSFRSI